MQSDIRVVEVEPLFYLEKARTPLKFGGVVMDAAEMFKARVRVESRAGRTADGWGAIFLSDVWAWPSPIVPHEERAKVMHRVAERCAELVAGWKEFAHPIDIAIGLEDDVKRAVVVSNSTNMLGNTPVSTSHRRLSPFDAMP